MAEKAAKDGLSVLNSLVEQCEGPQRYTRGGVCEIWIASPLSIDTADTAQHGDVLLAVPIPRHRLTDDARSGLEAPQDLTGVGIERLEFPGHDAGEHEIASRHHGRRIVRAPVRRLPLRP